MGPQAGFLDKLSWTKFARVIFFSSWNIVNCLKMMNQQPSLSKFGLTFFTIVVTVSFNMFVQLKCSDKYFWTLWTFVGLSLVTTGFVGITILLLCCLMSFYFGLIMLDAFAWMIVDVENFKVAQLLLASNATDRLVVLGNLRWNIEQFGAESTLEWCTLSQIAI